MTRTRIAAPLCLLLALVPVAGLAQSETGGAAAHPLDIFQPFMGPWIPDPDWEPLADDPSLHDLVPLNFEWTPAGTAIRFCEGLPTRGEHDACGIIVWNPLSSRAEYLALQASGELVFDGYYELIAERTMRRVYDVIDREGDLRTFRETFSLVADDRLDWRTDLLVDGDWIRQRPDGPYFHAIRPDPDPGDRLLTLSRLVGRWRPDPDRIPADMRRWRQDNGVTDGYSSFAWGTDRRWIEFGDHRRVGERWLHEGSGLIAWNPGRQRFTYREHTVSETALDGYVVVVDERTIERHYTAYSANGTARRWKDTWRWEDPRDDCFEWTTSRIHRGEAAARAPYWVCRIDDEADRGRDG